MKITFVTKEPLDRASDSFKWFDSKARELGASCTYETLRFPKRIDEGVVVPLGGEASSLFISDDFTSTLGYINTTKFGVVIPCLHPRDMYTIAGNKVFIERTLDKADNYARGYRDEEERLDVSNHLKTVLAYLDECLKSPEVCIDLETTGKDFDSKITAVGVSKDPNEALCFSSEMFGWDKAIAKLKQIVESPHITKIGQNFINFDSQILGWTYGMVMYGNVWDTLDTFKLLYPDLISNAGLATQGALFLYCNPWKDDSWSAKGQTLRTYCAKDVIRTYRIKKAQERELALQGNTRYHREVLLPVGSPISRAIFRGINFDHTRKEALKQEFSRKEEELRAKLVEMAKPYLGPKEVKKTKRDPESDVNLNIKFDVENPQKVTKKEFLSFLEGVSLGVPAKEVYLAKKQDTTKYGHAFGYVYQKAYKEEVVYKDREYNPNSSIQTLQIFSDMGIDVPQKRKADGTWGPATGKLELQRIIFKYNNLDNVREFAKTLLEYKPLSKFVSGYLNAEFPPDGRWRSQFKLVGTETGRASSQKYFGRYCGNLQNIPSNTIAAVYKECFVPDPGYVFFNFDQSAAESRVVAYLAQCQKLIDMFKNGVDFHCETTRALVGVKESDDVIKEKYKDKRQLAKPLNHGSAYGMGVFIMWTQFLRNEIDISKEEVEKLMQKWHAYYPEIEQNYHTFVEHLLETGDPLVNPLGRARFFTGAINKHMYKQAYADLPQSTIPGISNLMWQYVSKEYKDDEAMVLIQTHDSLSGQVRADLADSFKEWFINKAKEIKLTINGQEFYIPWDGKVGENYYAIKD